MLKGMCLIGVVSPFDAKSLASVPNCISKTRVWSEVGKNISLLFCQGEGVTAGSSPENYVSQPEGFGEEFYSSSSRAGLPRRVRVSTGPALL